MNLAFMGEFQADRLSKMKTKNWPEFRNVEILVSLNPDPLMDTKYQDGWILKCA